MGWRKLVAEQLMKRRLEEEGRKRRRLEEGRKKRKMQMYAQLVQHSGFFYALARASEDPDINNPALKDLGNLMVAGLLEILANFASASKAFRDAVRDAAEDRNIFEHFEHLFQSEYLAKMSPRTAYRFGSLWRL